jgi:hypothetical protein
MSTLVHCIYTSVQAYPLSSEEIEQLVTYSREKNAEQGITGILLHVGETFFQVLEGPEDVAKALYAKILSDPRHTRITRIIFEPISRRFFGDSEMNLATLSRARLGQLLEEADTDSREEMLSGIDEGRAKRLLRAFSDGRWRTQVASPLPDPAVRA